MCIYLQGGLFITNGTIPMEWIEEKPEKVYEFLEKQRPYVPPGESEKQARFNSSKIFEEKI